jgi:ubiquitin C-terminal hydrolase
VFTFTLYIREHDAQEALLQLLTMFEEESDDLLMNSFPNFNQQHESLIGINLSTRFNTVGEKNLRCFRCEFIAQPTIESVKGMLQLNFTQGAVTSSLHEMLSKYCEEEQVVDYKCQECGRVGQSGKSINVDTAPSELFLHLNRFKFDNSGQQFSKISTPVNFPEILKFKDCKRFPISNFTDEDDGSDANLKIHSDYSGLFNKTSSASAFVDLLGSQAIISLPKVAFEYRLSAVIRHSGTTIERGHYYADVYNSSDHIWRRFNDFNIPIIMDKVCNLIYFLKHCIQLL